jgi:hypothetical protein
LVGHNESKDITAGKAGRDRALLKVDLYFAGERNILGAKDP